MVFKLIDISHIKLVVSSDFFGFVLIWFGFNPSTYQESKTVIYGF